ncbi:MAG: hypothetical protein MJE77_23415 [Proteobacteria bacterium]|nr:hypothetical protein [Pseudomonadota bacterium]
MRAIYIIGLAVLAGGCYGRVDVGDHAVDAERYAQNQVCFPMPFTT